MEMKNCWYVNVNEDFGDFMKSYSFASKLEAFRCFKDEVHRILGDDAPMTSLHIRYADGGICISQRPI